MSKRTITKIFQKKKKKERKDISSKYVWNEHNLQMGMVKNYVFALMGTICLFKKYKNIGEYVYFYKKKVTKQSVVCLDYPAGTLSHGLPWKLIWALRCTYMWWHGVSQQCNNLKLISKEKYGFVYT